MTQCEAATGSTAPTNRIDTQTAQPEQRPDRLYTTMTAMRYSGPVEPFWGVSWARDAVSALTCSDVTSPALSASPCFTFTGELFESRCCRP